jgi:hypothetical protein
MKNRLIFCFLLVTATSFLSAQSVKKLQSRGPMFITSLSFNQGITRIPYGIIPGEEGMKKNLYKKTSHISLMGASQFMGFQFSPYFALGLGLGFEYWTVKSAFAPIYADLRFNMTDGKFAPHAYINLGYGNRWFFDSRPYKATTGNSNDYIIHAYTSGFMGEIGLGIKASVGYSTALVVTALCKVQESALRYYEGLPPSQSMKPILVNEKSYGMYLSAGIKIGVVF